MANSPLRAELFVTRPDGKMVPLVAIDELPHRIVIEGVPRVMSPFDIGGMTCVGCFGFRHRQHSLSETYEPTKSNADTNAREPFKAKFFITRDNGGMIPVVAMDEMPEHFSLENVPRSVSAFDITGMTCIGLHDARDKLHIISDVNEVPFVTQRIKSSTAPPMERDRTTSATSESPRSVPGQSSYTSSLSIPTTPSVGTSTANAAFKPGVKEFCSYWLRHGECDYAQQGCLYRHEMPLDEDTLRNLGLRDIPKWYREKHGLGSFLAAGGSGAAFAGSGLRSTVVIGMAEEAGRSTVMQSPRTKAPQDFRQFFDRRRPRNQTQSSFNTNNSNNSVVPGRERASSISSAIAYLKSRNQQPSSKPCSNETLQNHQPNEVATAKKVSEKPSESPDTASDMVKSGIKMSLSTNDRSTSAEEADISCTSSDDLTTTSKTPTHSLSPPSEARPTNRARRPSQSSLFSDIEADIHRQDAARKAKEDEAYKLSCEAYAAKDVVEAEVEKAQAKAAAVPAKATAKDVRGANGRKRGRGGKRGGNRGRKAVAKGQASN